MREILSGFIKSKMSPAPVSKGSDVLNTPEHFQNDSGFYGSGQKSTGGKCNFSYSKQDGACFYQSTSKDSFITRSLQKKRKLNKTAEDEFANVKRILFHSTPYSSGQSIPNSDFQSCLFAQKSTNNVYQSNKIKEAMRSQYTQIVNDLKQCSIETKIYRCEPTPIYPEYSPLKLNFSPLKTSNVSKKIVTKSPGNNKRKSWNLSLNLPEYKCDVLKKLTERQIWSPLTSILSHLSNEDLRTASLVSSSWCEIIHQDRQASKRLNNFMKEKCVHKENKFGVQSNLKGSCRPLLLDISNKPNEYSEQSLDSNICRTRYESFIEVAKNLGNCEILVKCPKCQYPAKNLQGSKYECTRELCMHTFCKECSGPFLLSHTCPHKQRTSMPNVLVGSRKSKKNLKRL